MQVKKFEAKSMKEALELVKVHLGPEAIILSARDTHKGFGLLGEKSVEVTAAVSEETLRKKKIAEARLREDLRSRFQKIPAAQQKDYINKMIQRPAAASRVPELVGAGSVSVVKPEARAQLKNLRYIDIPDEQPEPNQDARVGRERIRRAAEMARNASRDILNEPAPQRSPEVRALESQVRELKALVERFQKIPQVPLSMHPGAEHGIPFELSSLYQRLIGQGMDVPAVVALLKRAQTELDPATLKKSPLVDAWAVGQLLNLVEVSRSPLEGRYQVFMGSSGQGKTTSLVKLASHLVLKEKKRIAIISLDTVKLGAADQLRIFAQILNVPFAIVRHPSEWQVAEKKLSQAHYILVDCPGFNLRLMSEADWLKTMLPPKDLGRKVHFVQSILARDEETIDVASRYQMIGFDDVIFTRLDESSRQGLMLNFQERFRVPIHSFGTGPRVPEDYEFATKERVVDLMFKLTKSLRREKIHE